jgi:hypothetical protein
MITIYIRKELVQPKMREFLIRLREKYQGIMYPWIRFVSGVKNPDF